MTVKHLYPNSTPALNLNFKSSRVVDPRISCVRNSTATYVDPVSGLVKTAPANVARVDKNGLLVEESRTNSIAYSVVFTLAYGASNITATDNVAGAPDGTTTAASLMETNSTGFKNFYRGEITSGAAGNYAQSIFVKDNGRAYVNLRWFSISVSNCWHTVTFALIGDGSITQEQSGSGANFTNISRSIEHIGNGWYRITLGVSNPNDRIYPLILDGSDSPTPTLNSLYGVVSYTGDITKGYYIWGAQSETGTFPTSYIPTSGATATRAVDIVQIKDVANVKWFNPTAGTMIFDIKDSTGITQNLGGSAVGSIYNTSSPSNVVSYRPTNFYGLSLATEIAGKEKIGFAVDASSSALSSEGAFKSSTSPGYTVPSGVNRFNILEREDGQKAVRGILSRISYYSTRVSNSQLEALTQ